MAEKDSRRREIFVNIPAVRPPVEQSFEEQRMLDYMKAYHTTGRPPQPSPLNPTDRGARARAGLPPLFKPYVENGTVAAPEEHCAAAAITTLVPYTSAPPPNDINAIPDVHAYLSTPETTDVGNTVFLQHISCQYTYSAFSAEELRCKAYSTGKVFVPEVEDTSVHSEEGELLCIAAQPAYSKHSLEELRIAYMRTGKELTSDQIVQMRVFG